MQNYILDNEYVGVKAIVSGWGTLKEEGKPSCLLQEVEVPVMSLQACRNTSYSPRMISDNMLCAGYLEGQKDSCQVTLNVILVCNKFKIKNYTISERIIERYT